MKRDQRLFGNSQERSCLIQERSHPFALDRVLMIMTLCNIDFSQLVKIVDCLSITLQMLELNRDFQ